MSRRVASYQHGLEWIVLNDDTEWLDDPEPIISVTASLVADLFGRSNEDVIADLLRVRRRHAGNQGS